MAFSLAYGIHFMLLLLLLPSPITAQTSQNITLGSSLTANDANNSFWASPSDEFAFGFQKVEGGNFLLAIWFNKIPERTIVWSANRNNPAPRGSRVELTRAGNLVLNSPNGQEIWAANLARSEASHGAMLNSGNFVISGTDSSTLWQSFDEPTDTILPTQQLLQGGFLFSSFSRTNYSVGRFKFILQTDGNLVLYTVHYPKDSDNFPYLSTQSVGTGFQVIFNQSGFVYLTARNGSVISMVFANAASSDQFYQRAVLEYDGVLRKYVYPKSVNSSSGSPMAWSTMSFIPSNICLSIRQETGGGACGFNSYCTIGNDQRPRCDCPSSYTFIDPNDELGGCKPNFAPQSCDENSRDSHRFGFNDMLNMDWPLSDYEYSEPVTEDWCRGACLQDCFCSVAIFRNGECWKKRTPLSNGRIDPIVGGKAMIKFRKDNSTTNSPTSSGRKQKDESTQILIGSVLLGSSVFLNLVLLITTLFVVFCFNKRKIKLLQPYTFVPETNLRSFSYKELDEATDGFKEELGRGAFATVFKGALKNEEGNLNLVAVKKLEKMVKEVEKEFKAEMGAIGRTNHKNLVQLRGYCNEEEHRILVYEYMSRGSLASFLFENSSRPNWYERIQIAFGTARGLCYLHEDCSTQIIHCDIKPQNVLLDENLTVKISDFGLAKLLRKDQTRTVTGIRGTKGYVAPEWFKNMPITVKVDVYSFGVLLLEIIACRKNVESEVENENEMILSDWAYDCYREGKLNLLVENDEEAKCNMKRLEKFVMIAIWCIQEDPSLRPTMKKVTQMLEGAVDVSPPPYPYSFISSI